MTLSNNTLSVTTDALSMTFQGPVLSSFKNLLTGEEYVSAPKNFVLAITNVQTLLVPQLNVWKLDSAGDTAVLTASDGTNLVSLTITLTGEDAVFSVHGESANPGLVSYQWAFQGLNFLNSSVISPSEAGMIFNTNTPVGDLGDDYPVHWEAQMVAYQTANGGFSIQGLDQNLNFKTLHGSFLTGTLVLGVETYAPAPWNTATTLPDTSWIIRTHQGSWQTPASQYRDYARALNPSVYSDPSYAWVKNIQAVITIRSLDPTLLPTLAASLNPSQTLLYLQDWRIDGYDVGYPDYTPLPSAAAFVAAAHALGFRVMLHANLLGVSTTDPNYPAMSQYQMLDPQTLAPQGWQWTTLPPGNPLRFAYISPASSAFRQLFINSIAPAIAQLLPDALHLDAGGAIVNDGQGLVEGMNSAQGIRLLQQQILAAFPGIALGGESTSELMSPYNAFAQRWYQPTLPHPISTFLFGDQTLFYGFLDQPSPDDPAFIPYVQRYEGEGIMPTLPVTTSDDLNTTENPRAGILLQEMALWQNRGYAPDWNNDWGNRIFQYRSADGSSLATVDQDPQTIALNIDGQELYRRAYGVTQVTTPDYILNWPAFDDSSLYGLTSQNEYWLENPSIQRPDNLAHLTGVPPNYTIGLGSMIAPEFSYFELNENTATWFDFVGSFPSTTSGLLYGTSAQSAVQIPVGHGAVSKIAPISVGGNYVDASLYMAPPYTPTSAAGGAIYTDYTINVPQSRSANLTFQVGIDDNSKQAVGALVAVKIGDNLVWGSRTAMIRPGSWYSGQIDLSAYAGGSVTLQFIVDTPAPVLAQTVWVGWTNFSLNVDLSIPSALLTATGAAVPVTATSNAQIGGGSGNWSITASLPGNFAVFPQQPPQPALGSSLISLPFRTWRQSVAGVAEQASFGGSGTIGPASSGGTIETQTITAWPPNEGYTLLTWPLQVPSGATSLSVMCGVSDPPAGYIGTPNYSGMRFSVRINGKEVWGQPVAAAGWQTASIGLSAFQGQNIVLELVADSLGTNVFDWGQWADLTFH